MNKQSFVLIGGGEISEEETKLIDLEIKSLTNSDSPNILFFPIAANDSQGYIDGFQNYFTSLGFKVDFCKLSLESKSEILNKLRWADALYFGGGDTEYAMQVLNKINFKEIIEKVFLEKSLVISGISAGAMIWCSKIVLLDTDEHVESTRVIDGLGFLDFSFIPHYEAFMEEKILNLVDNKIYCSPDKTALVIQNHKVVPFGSIKQL